MKNVVSLISLITLIITFSCKNEPNQAQASMVDKINKEEALNLLHQWTDAYLTGNAARLEEVLDESWIYAGSANGKTTTKAATIEEFANADYKFQNITYKDLDVRLYDDIAIVRGAETMVITDESGNNPVTLRLRFTDVYQKKEGIVRAISTHSSPIGEG